MLARLFLLFRKEQQIREIDPPHRIIGMVSHRLVIQRQGGILISRFQGKRSEVVENAKVGRPAPKQYEIILLRLFESALFAQQASSLKAPIEGIRILQQDAIELLNTSSGGKCLRPVHRDRNSPCSGKRGLQRR